ncbi:SEL1-like repeat protein [Candidatus Odyssella thessalonicensis]|uniref:SEL1-like repeat protein n=1 Tax=Candidatus Odyssella thessalonicensis TaxID=84647 RepID=UPI000225B188|nr:SEL1-like repeat protein [Candidatus Odyssella thessalonicensis]
MHLLHKLFAVVLMSTTLTPVQASQKRPHEDMSSGEEISSHSLEEQEYNPTRLKRSRLNSESEADDLSVLSYNDLPSEMKLHIFSYLRAPDLKAMMYTHKASVPLGEIQLKKLLADNKHLLTEVKMPWLTTYTFYSALLGLSESFHTLYLNSIISPHLYQKPDSLIKNITSFKKHCEKYNLYHSPLFAALHCFLEGDKKYTNHIAQFWNNHSALVLESNTQALEMNLILWSYPSIVLQDQLQWWHNQNVKEHVIASASLLVTQGQVGLLRTLFSRFLPNFAFDIADRFLHAPSDLPYQHKLQKEAIYLLQLPTYVYHERTWLLLGEAYYKGIAVEKDEDKGVEYLEFSASLGNAEAAYKLGKIFDNGDVFEEDPEAAIKYYKQAASKGHVGAIFKLAQCYETGFGFEHPDFGQAFTLYKQAAIRGYAKAQYVLGVLYLKVKRHSNKAITNLAASASHGYAPALYKLASCYEKGVGVKRSNMAQAFIYYKDAADKGEIKAQHKIGLCYRYGYGTEENPQQAIAYLKKAADKGYARALHNLGRCYEESYGMEKSDLSKAFTLFLRAAKQGQTLAHVDVGRCYENGLGVAMDPALAVHHYKIAAKMGSDVGQYYVGWCYENGYGVEKVDLTKALKYYLQAASRGWLDAQLALAKFYEKGLGVKADPEKAAYYAKLAAYEEETE